MQKVFKYLIYFFIQILIFHYFDSEISIYLYINILEFIIFDIIYQFYNGNLYSITF